jgi:tetratricopeptide (TPR) repeat protein
MKLKEEKELQTITAEYEKALQLFHKKNYPKAGAAFEQIIATYKDSEFYSVLEIQTRVKVHLAITQAQLHPVKIKLETIQDYIWEGVYQLNAGNTDKALELFNHAEKENHKDAYLYFLMAAAYLKKEDAASSLRYVEKCIKKDAAYKVIVYNEPDFEPLLQNQDFLNLVE